MKKIILNFRKIVPQIISDLLASLVFALVLMIAFSISAKAQTPEQLLERASNPTPCIFSLSRSMGLSNWKIVRQWNSLENQYCERMRVGRFESAFSEGHDLPAEKLNIDWQPPEKIVNDPKTDAAVILKFNEQAKTLWQEYLTCHQTAEKARAAYLNLDSKCGLDIKTQAYFLSVQSFLMSTTPVNRNSVLNISFHPLFTQVLLENANATSWIPSYDPQPDMNSGYIDTLIMKFIAGGYSMSDLNDPSKHSSMQFHFYYLTRIKDEVDLQRLMSRKFRQVNSLGLLMLNKAQDCESLGLWPGASRVIAHELGKDFGNFDAGSDDLIKTYMNACGDFQYTNHPYSGETAVSYSMVKEFRKLSTRFQK